MKKEDVFIIVFLVYSIPFVTTPSMGPGLFDFLWTNWGWNVEYYIMGLSILGLVSFGIILYNWWGKRQISPTTETEK